MNYLAHPDGPDSPAALHSEAVGDAIAEAVAPHKARAERLQRLLYIACLRLRTRAAASRPRPAASPYRPTPSNT